MASTPRKMIAIAVRNFAEISTGAKPNVSPGLYALCDDGTLWFYSYATATWSSVPGVPTA